LHRPAYHPWAAESAMEAAGPLINAHEDEAEVVPPLDVDVDGDKGEVGRLASHGGFPRVHAATAFFSIGIACVILLHMQFPPSKGGAQLESIGLLNNTENKIGIQVAHGIQIPLSQWHDLRDFTALIRVGGFICTGTVSKNKVLTAKHCVDGGVTSSQVRVTASSRRNSPFAVTNIVLHPSLDIAILTLNGQHTNKKHLVLDAVLPRVGHQIRLAGFGLNHDGNAGRELHTTGPMQRVACNFGSGVICAGSGGSRKTSSCGGDSGGPWFQFRDNEALVELVGVNSFGFGGTCGVASKKTGLVSVAAAKDWILRHAPEFEFTNDVSCVDTDNGATDNDGDGCKWYTDNDANGNHCGKHDDRDFKAMSMCCRCGGGSRCVDTDNGAKDNDNDGCDWYDGRASRVGQCGGHDDTDFKARTMCCGCGGGRARR